MIQFYTYFLSKNKRFGDLLFINQGGMEKQFSLKTAVGNEFGSWLFRISVNSISIIEPANVNAQALSPVATANEVPEIEITERKEKETEEGDKEEQIVIEKGDESTQAASKETLQQGYSFSIIYYLFLCILFIFNSRRIKQTKK